MTVPLSVVRGESHVCAPGQSPDVQATHPHLFNIAGSKDSRGDNTVAFCPEPVPHTLVTDRAHASIGRLSSRGSGTAGV